MEELSCWRDDLGTNVTRLIEKKCDHETVIAHILVSEA